MVSMRTFIAVVAVLSLVVVAGSVSAGEKSGTKTIMGMDPFAIEIENSGDGDMKVSWDLNLTDGVPFNAALVDEENYAKLSLGLGYEAYKGCRKDYTTEYEHSVQVEEGTYYLVIESAHSSMDSSTVRHEVTWGEDPGSSGSPWCWPAALIVAMIAAVIAALFGRGRVGTRSTMRASTDAPPVREATEVAELSPQPEPPDMPADSTRPTGEGAAQLGPQPEPPDMPADAMRPTGEGVTELGPQPEPPDMPADAMRPTSEGATQLSPQPEPPDIPAEAWERTVPDPLSPDAETLPARDMPQAHSSPQPVSPGTEGGTTGPDEGMRIDKRVRPPGDPGGDGPTG